MLETIKNVMVDTNEQEIKVSFKQILELYKHHLFHLVTGSSIHGIEYGGWNYGRGIAKPTYSPENMIPES